MSRFKKKTHSPDDGQPDASSTKHGREATVYDAVAGRVSTQRFIPQTPYTSKTRDTTTSSALPIPADEVLFRRSGAPVRYEENDVYWANRHLRDDQILPDTDLLKAVHVYASDYYDRALGNKGNVSLKSMDETALLAVGILLEEAAEHILGTTGDLALVEGEPVPRQEASPDIQNLGLEDQTQQEEQMEVPYDDQPKARRRRKKRKVRHEIE